MVPRLNDEIMKLGSWPVGLGLCPSEVSIETAHTPMSSSKSG